MKTLITRIKRLALALCLATPIVSWAAPTATAVWRSNLGQAYAYSISPNAGVVDNGVITMSGGSGNMGPTIDLSKVGATAVSVLVKYSSLSIPAENTYGTVLASVLDSSGNELGIYVKANEATPKPYYAQKTDTSLALDNLESSDESYDVATGTGYMLFTYSTSGGLKGYTGADIASLKGGEKTNYKFSSNSEKISKISFGGEVSTRGFGYCKDAVIEEVSLFVGSALAATDVADYAFPTLTADNTASMTMTEFNSKIADVGAGEVLYFSAVNPVVTLDAEPSDAAKAYLRGVYWQGTVAISNVTKNGIDPTLYGNANSTLRFTGVTGYFKQAEYSAGVPAIELDNGEGDFGFYWNNGYSIIGNDGVTRAFVNTPELKGSGTLKCDTSCPLAVLIADKWDNFTGVLNLQNKAVWFGGNPADANTSTVIEGSVRLSGSIPSNYSTWTVKNGYYGTVEVAADATADASALFATSAWKGTVVVPEATNSTGNHIRIRLDLLGNANSIVRFNGLSSNTKDFYLNSGDSPTYNTTVDINGWVAINNGSSGKTITLTRVTCSNEGATLRLKFPGTAEINYVITTLDQFAGTLSVSGYTPLTIGTINLATAPVAGAKVVKLASGSYLKNVGSIKVSVNGVVDDTIELEQKEDGLYVVEPAPTTVTIAITPVIGATVDSITVDGQNVELADSITVDVGAHVIVTYVAAAGYTLAGGVVEFDATAETTSVNTSTVVPALILATITSADGQTVTPYTDVATAFAAVADDETLTLVGSSVSLTDDVAIATSFTLAGDAEGTTVSGTPGRFQLNGSVAMTLAETVTVTKQFQFNSKTATLTFPTDKAPTVRPYTAGGCQTGTRDNGDGTSTYYQYLFLQLQVGASNVTLAYDGSSDPVVTKQVYEGDELVFTATPAEGYENPVVTVNGESISPVDGKYTVVVGTVNVIISATATAIPPVAQVVHGETVTPYTSLAAAVAAATDGDTVKLVADTAIDAAATTTDDRLIVAKDITIDFGAYTLSVPGELEPTDNWSALFIEADVTVKGTTGGINCLDKADPNDAPGPYVFTARNGGTLTIESGVYHGGGTVVTVNANGKAVITGGTFTATPYDEPYGMGFVLNCHDASYTAGIASIEVKGGSFAGFNPANCAAEGPGTSFVASGYEATETSTGVWTVAEVQEVPVTPGGAQTDPVDTEAEAEAEAAKVVPSVPAAVAEALTTEQQTAYKALFEPKVVPVKVGEETKYAVEVALTEAAETAIQTAVDGETADVAAAAVAAAADPATTPEAEVSTTPGLYYVVEAGSSVDGIAPESCTLATGDSLKLKIPNKGTSGFYRISVSVTPVAVPQE